MASSAISEAARRALEDLRDYMRISDPGRNETVPLEFWRITDDQTFFEALSSLPRHISLNNGDEVPSLERMPEGFRLAYPIFWLEDDYRFNGSVALTNAGEWLLPSAIAAYDRIGMPSEARALEAALEA